MNIFEQLLLATEVIKNPRKTVAITGTGKTTCIRGLKRTEVKCADAITRIITYRGALINAVPNGTITLIDISEDMAA